MSLRAYFTRDPRWRGPAAACSDEVGLLSVVVRFRNAVPHLRLSSALRAVAIDVLMFYAPCQREANMLWSKSVFVAVSLAVFLFPQTATAPASAISDALLSKDANLYPSFDSGDTAEDRIANNIGFDQANNTFVVARHPREEIAPGSSPTSDPLAKLKTLVVNADAIVIGIPTRRVSSLTASHKFAFSDYEVTVNRIIKNPHSQILPNTQIVITRPGGVVSLDGVTFRAIDPEYPLFRLGVPYVLLLHVVQSSGSYRVNVADAYRIDGDAIVAGRMHSDILKPNETANAFLNDLSAAVTSMSGSN
jgi:hypothetical protein